MYVEASDRRTPGLVYIAGVVPDPISEVELEATNHKTFIAAVHENVYAVEIHGWIDNVYAVTAHGRAKLDCSC
jgi:hypothetical protein